MEAVLRRVKVLERGRAWIIGIGLPVAVYALAAVVVTWPLLPRLSTHLAGLGVSDSAEVVRHIWWARESLLAGSFPFEQSLLVYPEGFTSWLQWSHPLQYLPGAVVAMVVSPVTAFNLVLLITLVLNGCAAYILGRRLAGAPGEAVSIGALLGGLVFLAYPAMQGHLSVGHLGILTLWPLPLFAVCWWGVLRQGAGWRAVGGGALWFALTVLAYASQVVVLLMPLVLITGLVDLLSGRLRLVGRDAAGRALPLRDQVWMRAGAMVVGGMLLIVPFYVPLLTVEGRNELEAVSESGRIAYSADALAAVSPSPFGWLGDRGLVPGYVRDVLGTNSAEGSGYIGVIALVLALIALRRAEMRVWGVVALVALVVALGPLLKWRGELVSFEVEDVQSHVALPWALFEDLPVLSATRTPGRFNLLTGLAISALVSVGASQVTAWVSARTRRAGAGRAAAPRGITAGMIGVLGALVLLEYQTFAPFPTESAALSPYFDSLARESDVRAVLDLPVDNNLIAKLAMLQQMHHGHALIAGHALRRTPQNPALLGLLERAVLGDSDESSLLPPIAPEMARWLLSEAGADRVIVHKGFVSAAGLSHARDLLGPPVHEDETIAVFAVPPGDLPDDADRVVWTASREWSEPVRVAGFDGHVMGEWAAWYIYTPGDQALEVTFDAAALGLPRRLVAWMDNRLVAAQWVEAAPHSTPVTLTLWPEPGYHTVSFVGLDGCDPYRFLMERPSGEAAPLDDPACLSVAVGAPEVRTLDPAPVVSLAMLDHGVALRGYTLEVQESPRGVKLRLFWVAANALPASYALFVHLADPETDVPVAQVDAFPLVTTDRWLRGAAWTSDVWLPLGAEVPPGEYAVNVGWFEPESGARLAITFAHDRRASAGLIHLGLVTVGGE